MMKVLIVSNPSDAIGTLVSTLRANGCEVTLMTHQAVADLKDPEQIDWSIVLRDTIRASGDEAPLSRLPCIVVSEHASIRDAVVAIRNGAEDYLPLPVDGDEVMASIEQARLRANAQRSGDARNSDFAIVGDSPQIQDLRSRIERVAVTDTPLLIQGEPGTGKELTARAVHAASLRHAKPLITVNCGAIPANIVEAELFGTADQSGPIAQGLVDAAEGGTLFLDDVAALPAEVQARLLRLLQVGEVRPVGSAVAHPANVRVIAATHRDISDQVTSGRFREDLFYRLNVVVLQLPPLRQRGDDIAQLGTWLLAKTAARLGRPAGQFSSEALKALVSYNWPGNVRELANAVERAVILAEAPVITPELLAINVEATPAVPAVEGHDHTSLEDYFVRFVLENEEQFTETELAQKLGISRKSLWERRQRLNIPRRKTKTSRGNATTEQGKT